MRTRGSERVVAHLLVVVSVLNFVHVTLPVVVVAGLLHPLILRKDLLLRRNFCVWDVGDQVSRNYICLKAIIDLRLSLEILSCKRNQVDIVCWQS